MLRFQRIALDDGVDEDDAMLYGVGGEYQFAQLPISIGAGYSTVDFDGGDVDTWTVGVRWNFGGGTLRDRYLEGQSAPAFTDLFGGDLLRAAGGIEVEDDDGGGGGGCGDDSVGPCGNTLLDP